MSRVPIFKINKTVLFYLGFTILTFKYAMASTATPIEEQAGRKIVLIGLIALIIKIINTRYKKSQFKAMALVIILSTLSFITTGDDKYIVFAITVFAMKDIKLDNIVKLWTIIYTIIFICVVSTSLITGANLYLRRGFRIYEGIVTRYTFGYIHPNSVQGALLKIICGWLLVFKNRQFKKISYLIMALICFAFFRFTDSRAGFLACILVIFGLWFIATFPKLCKREGFAKLCHLIFWLIILSTLFAILTYGKNSLVVAVDSMMSGRYSLAARFIRITGNRFSLFGRKINYSLTELVFDCGIMNTMYSDGIIIWLLITLIYAHSIMQFWKEGRYREIIVILGFTIYAVIEASYSNFFMNLAMILCFYNWLWVEKRKEFLFKKTRKSIMNWQLVKNY